MAEDGAGGGNLRRARLAAGRSYGAPLDDPEHCWHAAHAAVAMHAALEGLNRRWEAEGRGPLAMGIAVHTGEAFAGTLGAPRKEKYAVLGDTVNTTSRMEGLNRDLGTRHPDQRRGAGRPEGPGDGTRPRPRDREGAAAAGRDLRAVGIYELDEPDGGVRGRPGLRRRYRASATSPFSRRRRSRFAKDSALMTRSNWLR